MNDIRTALNKLLGRGKTASKTPKALSAPMTAAPDQSFTGKFMQAFKPAPKPYKVMIRNAAGDLELIPATRAEMLAYCSKDSQWRRIA